MNDEWVTSIWKLKQAMGSPLPHPKGYNLKSTLVSPQGKSLWKFLDYLHTPYLISNDNTIDPGKEIILKFHIMIRSVI